MRNVLPNIKLPVLRETVKESFTVERESNEAFFERLFNPQAYERPKFIPEKDYYPQGQFHLHPKRNNRSGQSFIQTQRLYNGFEE